MVNLLEPNDTVVVCRNGVFGGRIASMAERCGATVVTVDDEWGRAVDPDKLERTLQSHPDAKVVAFVHAETSTGALSDAATLSRLAHTHGCLVLADTVTSLGGVRLEIDTWGLDAVYAGSQKCLSCTPGLSPVTFSERAIGAVEARRSPVQSWFMDVLQVKRYWGEGHRVYHHTAPINPLYGLHEALLMLREEGLEEAWLRHQRHHEALRDGLERLGLLLIVPERERIPHMNTVAVPEGLDEARVRRRLLEEHGVEIGAGLGALAGKVWRIGLMGYGSRPENIIRCLEALEAVLSAECMPVPVGEAVTAAMQTLEAATT